MHIKELLLNVTSVHIIVICRIFYIFFISIISPIVDNRAMLKASATDSTTQKLISLNSTDTEASTFFEVSGINESLKQIGEARTLPALHSTLGKSNCSSQLNVYGIHSSSCE